jgi:beta-glucanase (GH16 family)
MTEQTYVNAAGMALALSTTPTSTVTDVWAAATGVTTTAVGGGHTLYGNSSDEDFIIFTPTESVVIPSKHGIYTINDSAWDSSYTLQSGINNLIVGGTGDIASGNSSANLIMTEGGATTVSGGGGDDVFVLGSGADTVVDPQGSGSDVIYNFGLKTDQIRLDGSTQFTDWASIQSALKQVGSDVQLNMGGGQTLTFRNETVASFSSSNFLLPVQTSSFHLTFDDEFNSFVSSPDGSKGWMTSWPYGGINDRAFPGNGDNSYYSDSSVGVNPFKDSNGILDLTATVAPKGSNPDNLPYNTGVMTTYKSESQLYGYFEIRAELPTGQGLWPSFYMQPDDNSAELDIFEVLGISPTTLHATVTDWLTKASTTSSLTIPNSSTGFHTYGVDWEPTTVTFYMDGNVIFQAATPASMHEPMYMIVGMGVGAPGSWAEAPSTNSIFPATMQIDYIRAYATAATQDVSGTAAITQAVTITSTTTTIAAVAASGVKPFTGVVINDPNAAQTETATVTLSSTANGTLSDPKASTDGSSVKSGVWTISGSSTTVASALDGLVYTPKASSTATGTASTTLTAKITDTDGKTASITTTMGATAGAHTSTPTPTPTPTPAPTPTPTTDTLTLQMSEDSWNGDAAFTVEVNGKQVGGDYSTSALHASGDSGTFLLTGNWGSGVNDVQISFINDASGGSSAKDRNLYVNSIAENGVTYAKTAATLLSNGSDTFAVGGATPTAAAPTDTLTLNLSEDAWSGNAEFKVFIDGKDVTTPQVVSALHEANATQSFAFAGDFGAGSHTIGVQFVNDAYGGSASADRNLYINTVAVNGKDVFSGVKEQAANGTASFTFTTTH